MLVCIDISLHQLQNQHKIQRIGGWVEAGVLATTGRGNDVGFVLAV